MGNLPLNQRRIIEVPSISYTLPIVLVNATVVILHIFNPMNKGHQIIFRFVTDKPLQLIFRHTIKIKHLKLQPIIKQGVPYHGTHESPES